MLKAWSVLLCSSLPFGDAVLHQGIMYTTSKYGLAIVAIGGYWHTVHFRLDGSNGIAGVTVRIGQNQWQRTSEEYSMAPGRRSIWQPTAGCMELEAENNR